MTFSIPKSTLKKSIIKIFLLFMSTLSIVALLAAINNNPHSIDNIVFYIKANVWRFRLFRWSLIVIFFFVFPTLINGYARIIHLPLDEMSRLKKERLKITIWLILFELIVGENLLFRLIKDI